MPLKYLKCHFTHTQFLTKTHLTTILVGLKYVRIIIPRSTMWTTKATTTMKDMCNIILLCLEMIPAIRVSTSLGWLQGKVDQFQENK